VLALLLLIATHTRPAPAVPKALGACTAITADDLQRALGINFRRGQEASTGSQSTCDYSAGNAQVSVTIQRLREGVDISLEIEALKGALPGATVRRIGGTSFLLEIPGAGAQLHVIRGERDYVMVSILGLGDAAVVAPAAERLAGTALARL
jgi:hypothetical protein